MHIGTRMLWGFLDDGAEQEDAGAVWEEGRAIAEQDDRLLKITVTTSALSISRRAVCRR